MMIKTEDYNEDDEISSSGDSTVIDDTEMGDAKDDK